MSHPLHAFTRCKPSLAALLLASAASPALALHQSAAQDIAVLPSIVVEGMSDRDPNKGYVAYEQADVTRNGLAVKDTPQTIDTIDVSKYKVYGMNDLSVMLAGTPGVTTQYDMRGDGVMIRGFSADGGDIYRDGMRESGQVRRSTANIERIEILKGPASLLYGRSAGGGVVNMVSKYANFASPTTIGAMAGSWSNQGVVLDVNEAVADTIAVRLTGEASESDSFRAAVNSKVRMISPSVTFDNHDTLSWTLQYTYDKLTRSPDRGPTYDALPADVSIRASFVQDSDYVDDVLSVARSEVNWSFASDWSLRWAISRRKAEQNFDHFFGGAWCSTGGQTTTGARCAWPGYVRQTAYAWQETMNETLTSLVDVKGRFRTGPLEHNLLIGVDASQEDRKPTLFSNPNSRCEGAALCGYVDPFDYADRYNDRIKKPKPGPSQQNHHEALSQAVFVQDVVTLTPQIKMVAGLRYDRYEFRSTNLLVADGLPNRSRSYSDDTFSPSLGLVWRPQPAHSFYASYNKSFAPYGGRGIISISPVETTVFDDEPQFQEQYELGIKSDWLNQRLNTQLSVFNMERNNIRYRPDPDNDPYTWAVQGRQRSRGMEFSAIGRILDTVFIRGGYSYQEPTVRKDVSSPALVGNLLANAAKETGNLFVRWTPSRQWYFETGVTLVGDQWTNAANTTLLKGYQRFDAALGYTVGKINVSLAASNLTDKVYWRSGAMPGSPRNVLLRVGYTF